MTDTPVHYPRTRFDKIKSFIGDLARPFAIISTSFAASWASIVAAYRIENGNDGAIYLGAVAVLVGGIYGFKSWENAKTGKQTAEVEIAKATGEVK